MIRLTSASGAGDSAEANDEDAEPVGVEEQDDEGVRHHEADIMTQGGVSDLALGKSCSTWVPDLTAQT